MKTPRHTTAFTLIELLAVIAIIAVLASIVIATVGKVRRSAARAEGVAILRGVGQAILLYANDHKGKLPGPLYLKQVAIYRSDTRTLLHHIGPYLGAPSTPNGEIITACRPRAWSELLARVPDASIYRLAYGEGSDPSGNKYYPFGNTSLGKDPMTLEAIPWPTRAFALRDIRKSDDAANSPLPDNSTIWGDVQHLLFFDAHVERRPL
ncbi:hypothetical protein OPIT5_08020 [Opitutaceae bacterium TAV5]|nr:hypothetical protein OPIT5_08020 [Opitutaceae bacterium TAV5]